MPVATSSVNLHENSDNEDDELSDASDLESIQPILHFKEHKWRQFKTEYAFTQHSVDYREFIKFKIDHNGAYIYSCGILYPTKVDSRDCNFIRFNKANLLFCNGNNYVATYIQKWKVNYQYSFAQNKEGFLKNVEITQVLLDSKAKERQESYTSFISLLNELVLITTSDEKAAEDIFQLNLLLDSNRNVNSVQLLLQSIARNGLISSKVKETCENLGLKETEVIERNSGSLKFANDKEWTTTFFHNLHQICTTAKTQHVQSLESTLGNVWVLTLLTKLVKECDTAIFAVRKGDITLFSDLATKTDKGQVIQAKMLDSIMSGFVQKVKSIRRSSSLCECIPLTDSIFFFLFKSFQELLTEIANKSGTSIDNLVENSNNAWELASISWGEKKSTLNHSIENQARYLSKLLSHFSPTKFNAKEELSYQFVNSEKISIIGIRDSRKYWLYLLDDAIHKIQSYKENKCFTSASKINIFQSLVDNVGDGFANFVKISQTINHESFRLGVHTIARFLACVRDFIVTSNPKFKQESTCEKILANQGDSFAQIFSQNNDAVKMLTMTEFKSLVDEYDSFWKITLSFLLQFEDKFPYGKLKTILEKISDDILKLVEEVQKYDTFPKEMLHFFKSLNDFLDALDNIDYSLLVKSTHNVSSEKVGDKDSYRILDNTEYVEITGVRHFVIEIVQSLVNTLTKFGTGLNRSNWDDGKKLSATTSLLSSMAKSFGDLKDQEKYEDFTNFLTESTQPFSNLVENMHEISSSKDFISRVDRLTDSMWYMRKQNEIGIKKALELYWKKNVNFLSLLSNDFEIPYKILESCYDTYLAKLNTYLSKASTYQNREDLIPEIVEEMLKVKASSPTKKFTKEKTLPILAGLAAVWALQFSRDMPTFLKPHCIQILCILRLLGFDNDGKMENHLAEVLTGQGKSLVFALLAATLNLSGYKVRVVCYSKYLADRDKNDFADFFATFFLTDISYGTFREMAEQVIEPVVNGSKKALRDLIKDRITGSESGTGIGKISVFDALKNTVLLVDEVDVFFTPEYYGSTYNPATGINFVAVTLIQPLIWNLAKSSIPDNTIMERVESFIFDGVKQKNLGFAEFNEFISNTTEYPLLHRHTSTLRSISNSVLWKEHLELMITDAKTVAKEGSNKNGRYRIKKDGKLYYLRNDGIESNRLWFDYLTAFHYFSLKEEDGSGKFDHMNYDNYGFLNIYCGSVSYAYLPRGYHTILGVSGTVSSLAEHEEIAIEECFKVKTKSIMPSFFGRSNLIFHQSDDFSISSTKNAWLDKIFSRIEKCVKSDRAVLVFFDTDKEIDTFIAEHSHSIDKLKILTENTDENDKKELITGAGYRGTVTLATRGMGRGVDFMSSLPVEKNGGMHVIQTFFSEDVKEETQIKGRTARKDNKGSYEMCLCEVDLAKDGFKGEDAMNYESLCNKRIKKMQEVGVIVEKSIKESAEKHDATMALFEGP